MIRTESSGRWQNRDCSIALPYVCKKRPNATLDPFTTGGPAAGRQCRRGSQPEVHSLITGLISLGATGEEKIAERLRK